MLKQLTLVILLFSLLFVIPITSSAQGSLQVSSLEVAFWPEYDRPEMLVIYQLRLSEETPTPAVVTLPIPAAVGEPHAVAAWYPDGSLDDSVSWTTRRQGDWTLVEVTTVTSGVWLEFYDELAISETEREYSFTWAGELAVDALSFDVQHPIGAVNLRLNPDGEEQRGSDGLTRTQVNLGRRGLGEPATLELSYSKPGLFTRELPPVRPNPTLAQFEVALWPEYDRMATLVIMRGGISPDVPLPATLYLPIPASAGDPHAVAVLGEGNRLFSTEFERQVEGDWAWISFQAENPVFQVEFYDELIVDGNSRTYTYTWPGALTTGSFHFELQQPVGATEMRTTPVGALGAGTDGLTYLRSSLGPQQSGSPLLISFAYEKDSAEFSADSLAAAPSIDRPATTQGSTPDLSARLPYILGGFGLALIALGILFYLRMQGDEKAMRKKTRTRKRKPRSERQGVDLDAAAVFCHVCGSKANASDHFCRSCGTKLRH